MAETRGDERRLPVDPVPVQTKAPLDGETRGDDEAILQPRPDPCGVHGGVQAVRQTHSSLDARSVADVPVAVPVDSQAGAGAQAVDVEARADDVTAPHELDLLAQGEIAHLELSPEVHVGLLVAHVVLRGVGASLLRAELGIRGHFVTVDVERRDRAGRHPSGGGRVEREGGQVVPSGGDEGPLVAVALVLEERVGRLTAHQAEEGESAPGPGLPVDPGLDVTEGRQLGSDDLVGDQVVVGSPPGHEPRPPGFPWKPAFQHQVRVGHAHGCRASQALGGGSGTILDHQERGESIPVLGAERAGGQLEEAHRLRVEGAGQAEEPIGVVDLHPVHDGEILIRPAATDRETAVELGGGSDAGKRLERSEDVVGRPRHHLYVRRSHRELGRRIRLGCGSVGGHLHLFAKAAPIHQHELHLWGVHFDGEDEHRRVAGVPVGFDGQGHLPRGEGRELEASVLVGCRAPPTPGDPGAGDGLPGKGVDHPALNTQLFGRGVVIRPGGLEGRHRAEQAGNEKEAEEGSSHEREDDTESAIDSKYMQNMISAYQERRLVGRWPQGPPVGRAGSHAARCTRHAPSSSASPSSKR